MVFFLFFLFFHCNKHHESDKFFQSVTLWKRRCVLIRTLFLGFLYFLFFLSFNNFLFFISFHHSYNALIANPHRSTDAGDFSGSFSSRLFGRRSVESFQRVSQRCFRESRRTSRNLLCPPAWPSFSNRTSSTSSSQIRCDTTCPSLDFSTVKLNCSAVSPSTSLPIDLGSEKVRTPLSQQQQQQHCCCRVCKIISTPLPRPRNA